MVPYSFNCFNIVNFNFEKEFPTFRNIFRYSSLPEPQQTEKTSSSYEHRYKVIATYFGTEWRQRYISCDGWREKWQRNESKFPLARECAINERKSNNNDGKKAVVHSTFSAVKRWAALKSHLNRREYILFSMLLRTLARASLYVCMSVSVYFIPAILVLYAFK